MATDKTRLTELATAVGLVYEPSRTDPLRLDHLVVPGLAAEIWQPAVLPATTIGSPHRELLLRALDNGRAFRQVVLSGRLPDRVEWVGGARAVWTSDIPRDLTVDGVWFIQAKYDSTCVLNTSPGSLVDDLLVDHTLESRHSWFAEVALDQLQAFYERVRDDLSHAVLATSARGATSPTTCATWTSRPRPPSRRRCEAWHPLHRRTRPTPSSAGPSRWRPRCAGATASTPPACRSGRRCCSACCASPGGPYWLLGTKGHEPHRLRVMDTRTWRERFELKRFEVLDAHAGQPQVNWRAEIRDRLSSERRVVDGCCEIRWSHGKLQGNPECKVQVTTALASIPGYEPMS